MSNEQGKGGLTFRNGQVIDLIAEQAGVDAKVIRMDDLIESNLGMDSLDKMGMDSLDKIELVMALEEEFEVEISDEQAEKCKTVADVVALVDRLAGSAA